LRFLAVLVLIVALGLPGGWFFGGAASKDQIREVAKVVTKGATEARDAVLDKLHGGDLNFSTED